MTVKQNVTASKCLNMLFSDDSFTPEAEYMLKEFFSKYSTNGLMSKEQACDYIYASTNTRVKPHEHRVN